MEMILRNIYQVLVNICQELETMNQLKAEEINLEERYHETMERDKRSVSG